MTPLHILQCKKWVGGFKRDMQSLDDDARPGRPVTAATQEKVNKVYGIVMADNFTEIYLASTVGSSQERVHAILTEYLAM